MAILKHIKSRNANYPDALDYLLYQHDEENGKPILDEYGNRLLREEFYIDFFEKNFIWTDQIVRPFHSTRSVE